MFPRIRLERKRTSGLPNITPCGCVVDSPPARPPRVWLGTGRCRIGTQVGRCCDLAGADEMRGEARKGGKRGGPREEHRLPGIPAPRGAPAARGGGYVASGGLPTANPSINVKSSATLRMPPRPAAARPAIARSWRASWVAWGCLGPPKLCRPARGPRSSAGPAGCTPSPPPGSQACSAQCAGRRSPG